MPGSIWKGLISFGLLNIPVNLQNKDGREVPWDRIVKGYEFEKSRFVIINKEDFVTANPRGAQTIDVQDFIH